MINQYEPLFDYENLNKEFSKYFKDEKGWLTEYKKTEELENSIAKFLNVKHCIAVNNGTISLSLALLANNIHPNDKVIVPNLTMIATANAVRLIGAKPVFIDINKETLTLNLELAKKRLEKGDIKAIIYVSLNGKFNVEIFKLQKEFNIPVIEDNAQSFGSKYIIEDDIKFIGDTDNLSSFSFSMPKIITMGQGGCLTTNNDFLAKKIKKLKDFGKVQGGDGYDDFGINCKITEMQAIVGLSQIRNIDWRINRKQEIYNMYHLLLKDIEEIEFINTNINLEAPWFIDIYVEDKEELKQYLLEKEIKTREVYPPLTSQSIYKNKKKYPISKNYSERGLWLPSSLNLENKDIKLICEQIKKHYKKDE